MGKKRHPMSDMDGPMPYSGKGDIKTQARKAAKSFSAILKKKAVYGKDGKVLHYGGKNEEVLDEKKVCVQWKDKPEKKKSKDYKAWEKYFNQEETEMKEESEQDRAYRYGWSARKTGHPHTNNPHERGSELHNAWAKGWKSHGGKAFQPFKNAKGKTMGEEQIDEKYKLRQVDPYKLTTKERNARNKRVDRKIAKIDKEPPSWKKHPIVDTIRKRIVYSHLEQTENPFDLPTSYGGDYSVRKLYEEEQLDEMSPKKMVKYGEKAVQAANDEGDKLERNIDAAGKPLPGRKNAVKNITRRMKNRTDGYMRAERLLNKKGYDSEGEKLPEETQVDEAAKDRPFTKWAAKAIYGKKGAGALKKGACPSCGSTNMTFRDALSKKEWGISGMCQKCQDSVFKNG